MLMSRPRTMGLLASQQAHSRSVRSLTWKAC